MKRFIDLLALTLLLVVLPSLLITFAQPAQKPPTSTTPMSPSAPRQYPIAVPSVQKVALPAFQSLQVAKAEEKAAAAEYKAKQLETKASERDYFDAINALKKEAGIPIEEWDKYDLTSDDGNRTFAFALKPAPVIKQ